MLQSAINAYDAIYYVCPGMNQDSYNNPMQGDIQCEEGKEIHKNINGKNRVKQEFLRT